MLSDLFPSASSSPPLSPPLSGVEGGQHHYRNGGGGGGGTHSKSARAAAAAAASSISPHTTTTTTATAQKPVRLRLACDACTTAKVKCSRTNPCERCVHNKDECRYSASRRHGKRSRHKKPSTSDADLQETPLFSPSASTSGTSTPALGTSLSSSSRGLAAAAAAAARVGPLSAAGGSSMDSSSTMMAFTDFGWGAEENDDSELVGGCGGGGSGLRINTTAAAAAAAAAAASRPSTLSEELEDWLHRDMDMDITFEMDSAGGPHQFLNHHHHNNHHHHPWTTPPESIINQPHLFSSGGGGRDAAAELPSPSGSTIVCASSSHGCENEAISILQSLHYTGTTTGGGVGGGGGGSSSACGDHQSDALSNHPTVETVLVANQAALTRLAPLLTCSCVRNPHIALLHGSILSKVMFWYRLGVTGRGQAEGVAVVPLRPMEIQLGMLDLDTDDQATLQRTVLLRELRKAEKIIQRFDVYFIRDEQGSSCLGVAMEKIQEELTAIIQEIKRQL